VAHEVGQVAGVAKDILKGASDAATADMTLNLIQNHHNTKHPIAYKTGEVIGHTLSALGGVGETTVSGVGEIGGIVLDGSGVLAPVGVTVNVGATAGMIHGSAVAIKGASNAGQSARDLYNLIKDKEEKPHVSTKGKGEVRSFTKEELRTKPKNSPDPEKWQKKGGSITIDDKDTWTYQNKDGHSVTYTDGFPDFKTAGHVKQEVEIGRFKDYNTDFKKADELAPNGPRDAENNTWHHHQDGKTMQEVNKEIHKDFTHRGGMALKKRK
jgi:hypothetical protein